MTTLTASSLTLTRTAYAAGTHAWGIAGEAFKNHGKVDIVAPNWDANSLSVLLGNGNGGYQAPPEAATDARPHSVAVGDLKGDGTFRAKVEYAATWDANDVSVLLGNGMLQAPLTAAVRTGPHWISNGDVNGDGKADLAVAKWSGNIASVLIGQGNGMFRSRWTALLRRWPRRCARATRTATAPSI